jgi:proteasome accessory factor B
VERFQDFSRRRHDKFDRPLDWDPRAFVADAFGITVGEPRTVVVRFGPTVAEYIRERRWHRSQGLSDRPDGSVEVVLRCALAPELKHWILGFGADAEVLEPAELRAEVEGVLQRALDRYQGAS